MSLRGILRRAVRRRAVQQLEESDDEGSQKNFDEEFSTSRQQLIGYFAAARLRIHPEYEEEILWLNEEGLSAAREEHEYGLMRDMAGSGQLSPVEKTRLQMGMTNWLERLDAEQTRIDSLVADLDHYMSAAAEFEKVSAKLAGIMDDRLFSMETEGGEQSV